MKKNPKTKPYQASGDITLEQLAGYTKALHDEYLNAGFSPDQSFELTKIVISSVCGNYVNK